MSGCTVSRETGLRAVTSFAAAESKEEEPEFRRPRQEGHREIPSHRQRRRQRAQRGEPAALDALLLALQGPVFNLALRMLGRREDAQDASQEILLRITTHLASFRGESQFSTWAFRIASNALLSARTKVRETPTVSLEPWRTSSTSACARPTSARWNRPTSSPPNASPRLAPRAC
ncbi:MAG: sigma-70 family RNA polymerase sigma factor [Pseudomonas sp.]